MRTIIFLLVVAIGLFFFARWFFGLEFDEMWRAAGMVLGSVSFILFACMIGTLFLTEFILMIFLMLGFSGTFFGILAFQMITQPELFSHYFAPHE